jgi:hypothetical protein
MLTTDCSFRAVDDGEVGIPFEEYLYARAGMVATGPQGPRELYQRVLIFIQQYDHLRDDRSFHGESGEPSMVEYAQRWRMTERSAYRALQEFVTVFPELGEHPEAICEELWNGIRKQAGPSSLMRVLSVKVKPR